MSKGKIELKISKGEGGAAYLSLPVHPGDGIPAVVAKQTRLADLVQNYKGDDIYLDFDKDGRLIGIEILT